MKSRHARYYWLSLASGLVWGLIALGISIAFDIFIPWLGIAASPLIGVGIGALSRPFFQRSTPIRVIFVVTSVYIATTLFGLVSALGTVFITEDPLWAGILVYPAMVTLIPILWFVFPLALLNHVWLGFHYKDERRYQGPFRRDETSPGE